jgi:hypothetical protein
MNYPAEILPNSTRKFIDCDLSDHFIIRHVDIEETENLTDPETGVLYKKYICRQSDHIYDLSSSLLGIYKPEHIHVSFTEEAGKIFHTYCAPDEDVQVPIYQEEFFLNSNRKFWCAAIDKLHNREFIYNSGTEQFIATCIVKHTPTRGNYWHFSLRWTTNTGSLDDMDDKQRRSIAKKIGHSAIVAICQFAKIELPEFEALSKSCYLKN